MRQTRVWVSLLLAAWLAGCATDVDLQGVHVDATALARQQSERHLSVDARVQQLYERVGRLAPAHEEMKRRVTQLTTTVDGVRVQLQRLQADVQETLRRAQRSAGKGEEVSAAQWEELQRRLDELEQQLHAITPGQ